MLTDVTLVFKDEQPAAEHNVNLSAISTLFRNILNENTHKHPLIYPRGTKAVIIAKNSISCQLSASEIILGNYFVLNLLYIADLHPSQLMAGHAMVYS